MNYGKAWEHGFKNEMVPYEIVKKIKGNVSSKSLDIDEQYRPA